MPQFVKLTLLQAASPTASPTKNKKMTPKQSSSSVSSPPPVRDEDIKQLVQYGFAEEDCRAMLHACNNDLNQAAANLFEKQMAEEGEPPHCEPPPAQGADTEARAEAEQGGDHATKRDTEKAEASFVHLQGETETGHEDDDADANADADALFADETHAEYYAPSGFQLHLSLSCGVLRSCQEKYDSHAFVDFVIPRVDIFVFCRMEQIDHVSCLLLQPHPGIIMFGNHLGICLLSYRLTALGSSHVVWSRALSLGEIRRSCSTKQDTGEEEDGVVSVTIAPGRVFKVCAVISDYTSATRGLTRCFLCCCRTRRCRRLRQHLWGPWLATCTASPSLSPAAHVCPVS